MSNIPEGATHTYTVRGKKSYRRMAGDLWEAYIDGEWFGVMHPHAHDYVKIQAATEWAPSTGSIVRCGTHNRDVEILKEPELVPYVSAACRALDNNELFWGGQFSPIKTDEQIEAEKVSKQLDSDLVMYGVSFSLTNDDGSISRIDPTKIFMRKQVTK